MAQWLKKALLTKQVISEDGERLSALEAIARRVVDEALAGNMFAIREIGDRLDGRAVSGDSREPQEVQLIVNVVRFSDGALDDRSVDSAEGRQDVGTAGETH